MLQNKDITKIQEIKTLFNDRWKQPDFFSQQIKLFKCTQASQIFKSIKKYGVPVWDVLQLLLVLPFTTSKTINAVYTDKLATETKGEKNIYYRLLAHQKFNWRSILLLFVKQYLKLDDKFTSSPNEHKCLIFDDTDIEKTGKKIEGVSKIFNHVTKTFILGYKLLVAGYWNGAVFIPVDFSFHREQKNNKKNKYGMSGKEYKNQKKTKRTKGSPTVRRYKELNRKKTQVVIEMFKRIVQRKIAVDYILMDSWFTSLSLIKKLKEVSENVAIIGMYKYNSKIQIGDKEYSLKQLRKQKKKMKYSRKTRYYYLSFIGKIDGLDVKVFLIRKGKRGAWHTIISTDKQLGFNKMIEIYAIRWSIEVFFKEAKQLLGLGKNQSTNFDVQVAQTTITMIQYLMISLKYRTEAYETINGLFKDLKQDYIEYKLNERIMGVIIDILTVLENLGVQFDYELVISKLIAYSDFDTIDSSPLESCNSMRIAV